MISPRTFFGYTLWPVLNDDTGEVDYWDVHDFDDEHGEGDPIAEMFSTCELAKAWVRQRRRDERTVQLLERLALR